MQVKMVFGVVSIVGIVLVAVAGIVGWAVLPGVIDSRIEDETQLISGSETWNKWSDITLPIQMKFFIYHVTNPDEVEQNGTNPILEEYGPYVYDEKRTKEDLVERSGVVYYRQRIIYTFNEGDSYGSETDEYNVINVAYLSVIDGVVRKFPDFLPAAGAIAQYLKDAGQHIVMRGVSVQDLTFNGYDVSAYTENALINGSLTEEFSGGRFGLYKGKNDTDDGLYEINSGRGSSEYFGQIIEWNHKTSLGYWGDTPCDKISGSDGSIFPPFVSKDRVLRTYIVDMCRSLHLTYVGETEIHGIKGYQFATPPDVLEDPRTNPNNRCFCLKEDINECEFSGILDVGTCRNDAPIFMSTPHFLGADPKYQNATGLIPDIDRHRTILTLEPNSGVLLDARKRIQVNIRLRKYLNIQSNIFENVPELLFPVIWAEETVLYTEDDADDLKGKLLNPIKIVNISRWTVVGVGSFMCIAGALLFFFVGSKSSSTV